MRYFSKIAELVEARRIAHSALQAASGQTRLQRCRALLDELDPDRPPTAAQAREFHWQYRALRERVHLYSERLDAVGAAERAFDYRLRKTETAIELSLQYFRDALTSCRGLDDDGDDDP
jgi:hypothetical protein